MALAVFYHLTQGGPEDIVAQILARAREQGWRVMLRGTAPARLAAFDDRLWTDPANDFVPHGMQGGPDDARQPLLIGTGAIANGAEGLVLIDGAEATAEETLGLRRLWVVFDGQDETAREGARGLWRRITAAGIAAQYWSDEGGRWQMKTERAAAPA